MSPTMHSPAFRMLTMAGFLGLASLAVPPAASAQTLSLGRALLNPTPIISYGTVAYGTVAPAPAPAPTVDGERALLGRATAGLASQPALAGGARRQARPVEGEQALLGKVAPSNADRLRLAL